MNWIKTLQHDVRRGLCRWRYFAGFLLFSIPCMELLHKHLAFSAAITWGDYVIACFRGVSLQSAINRTVELPVSWLLIMVGANLLGLDYFFRDLSLDGQQILLRCESRRKWYFSKCIWNMMSSSLYFLTGILTTLIFTLLSHGEFSLANTPGLIQMYFNGEAVLPVSGITTLRMAVLTPWATICTLNMIQMVLLLYIKPVYSFLVCVVVLLASVYVPSPFCLGNGAMMFRTTALMGAGLSVWKIWSVIVVLMAGSLLIGMARIQKMDFLTVEV